MGGWRPIEEALERAGATYDAAPLTEREAVLERTELPRGPFPGERAWSTDPRAIERRRLRRQARERVEGRLEEGRT